MFFYSPVAILAITGGRTFFEKDKSLTLVSAAAIVSYIVMAAAWTSWFGGKVWGSRLVVPIIPLLGVLLAAAIDQLYGKRPRKLWLAVVLLGAIGLGMQVLTIVQNPALSISVYVQNGYATQWDAIWSVNKNWLALEIKSLSGWNACNLDAYSLRMLFPQCGGG